jgi:phosphoglycolate phosphatase-like HAD superfamily hydrolase
MTPTVLLFDVDGTLVNAGGAGKRAMAAAFEAVCQAPEAVERLDLRGMTDSAIFRDALRAIGHRSDDGVIARLAERYLSLLPGEIARADRYEVLPGVPGLLEALGGRPELVVGLGTGNLERGARIKLEHGGIDHHFPFGGFGSDHEAREEILRIGAERGAARLGVPLARCRVVVIGDTPRDVEAGLRIGGEVVGVGTGGYPPPRLIELGARYAFPDLSAPGVAAALEG